MNAATSAGFRGLAFDTSLYDLKQWRDATAEELAAFRRWAVVARLIDEHAAARLAHLERRLAAERLLVAFIGEPARGKSELINALFFPGLSAQFQPPGAMRTTLCPTEILHDPMRPAAIRLLPIETRSEQKSLREFLGELDTWREVPLDPAKPESLAPALDMLSESMHVTAADAASLGVAVSGEARVDVPRWRYAVVNIPHPLLKAGLVILDAPGHQALDAEPELALNRVPDADAIVLLVAVDDGASAADRDLWVNHIAPVGSEPHTRFVVLNKIDALRVGSQGEAEALVSLEQRVRETAERLEVHPARIFPLSAREGLAARIRDDRDALTKSRLTRLEEALSQGLLHRRRAEHATVVRAETRALLTEAKALLEGRHDFMADQLQELAALQGKNQKLVEALARKAADERKRLEAARQAIVGVRGVHNRHAEELGRLLNPNEAREAGARARAALVDASFSRGIGEALDAYFHKARERLERAIEEIGQVKRLMASVSRKFFEEYAISAVDTPEFSTDRFLIELDRLEEHCMRDFRSASSLLMRGRKSLGAAFFDTIALKVILVFEIADREVRTWMMAFIRPLETQLAALQEQANSRLGGMARIQDAETDLVARVAELEGLIAEVRGQLSEWEAHHQRLQSIGQTG